MVVLIVHQHGILTVEREYQTPVTAYAERPMPFEVSVQRVKPPARSVHVHWRFSIVQRKKLLAEPFCVLWLDTRLRPSSEKSLHTLMPETPYHNA